MSAQGQNRRPITKPRKNPSNSDSQIGPSGRHERIVVRLYRKIESTVRYRGVEVDDAIEIAEKIDI